GPAGREGGVARGSERVHADEGAVGVDRANTPPVTGHVVAEPAHAGRAGVDLALYRGPLIGCGATQRPVPRARLDHENEPCAVAFEALEGAPGGLARPRDQC